MSTSYPIRAAAVLPDPAAAVLAASGAVPDRAVPDRGVEDGPSAACQYCLSDCTYTPIAWHLPQDKRCPVCGSAYSGPRRSAAFQVLLAAGLVAGSTTAENRYRTYALGRSNQDSQDPAQ